MPEEIYGTALRKRIKRAPGGSFDCCPAFIDFFARFSPLTQIELSREICYNST